MKTFKRYYFGYFCTQLTQILFLLFLINYFFSKKYIDHDKILLCYFAFFCFWFAEYSIGAMLYCSEKNIPFQLSLDKLTKHIILFRKKIYIFNAIILPSILGIVFYMYGGICNNDLPLALFAFSWGGLGCIGYMFMSILRRR